MVSALTETGRKFGVFDAIVRSSFCEGLFVTEIFGGVRVNFVSFDFRIPFEVGVVEHSSSDNDNEDDNEEDLKRLDELFGELVLFHGYTPGGFTQ